MLAVWFVPFPVPSITMSMGHVYENGQELCLKGTHQMTLEQEIQAFQQQYVNLEQQAEQGSLERQAYSQIVVWMNSAQNVTPAKNRAFHMQILLVKLAKCLTRQMHAPLYGKLLKS